jgi:hypothetical protein
MKNWRISILANLLGITLLLGGCGNAQHDATEAAINAAETALNAAHDATDKYAPEQAKAAQDALLSAKAGLAKGDYGAALKNVQNATQKAKEAVATAAARKEEWAKTWQNLNATAPKSMNEVQIKLDAYKKYGRLPTGVAQETMDEAETQFDQLKQGWADSTAAYKGGHFAEAMKKASLFKDGLEKLRERLGLPS